MRYKIQQLSLGGILDQAISLTKNHFGQFFVITLGVFLVNFLQQLLLAQLQSQLLGAPGNPGMDPQQMVMLNRVLTLASLPVLLITNAAIVYGIARAYLGRPASIGAALGQGLGAFFPMLWTLFLMVLAIAGGLILLIVPGILFAFWFSLATYVVIVEKVYGVAALKRSKALMRGNIGTVFAMGLVLGLINLMLVLGASFVPQPHVRSLSVAVVQSVATILGSAAGVVFYFSCRCKLENFDLHLLAATVGEKDVEVLEGDQEGENEGGR